MNPTSQPTIKVKTVWTSAHLDITNMEIRMWHDDIRHLLHGIYLGVWTLVIILVIKAFL